MSEAATEQVTASVSADPPTDELLRLDVHGRAMASATGAAAEAAAGSLGFAPGEAERVGRLVADLCERVAGTDFDDPDTAQFEVSVFRRPAALGVRVADHGLPLSLEGESGRAITGGLLASGVADRASVSSDGDGNSVTVEVRRDPATLGHLVDEEMATDDLEDPPPPRVERLRREHLEGLARCTWRVYGHTYVADFLYHPEEMWRLVQAGRLHSVVAIDERDDVIGHVGIELEHRGARVGDTTLALTDPRHRGHHVLGAVGSEIPVLIEELRLVGTFAEAVTPDTITQRFEVDSGAVETGILLGFIPSTMEYRGFPAEVQRGRQSAVLSYRPLGRVEGRTVHLPEPYAEIMAERYATMALDREMAPPAAPGGVTTRFDVAVDQPRGLATLEVASVGDDAPHVVDRARRELCAAGTQVVYAELPLDDPATPHAVDGLRERGFIYGGFVPELRGSDILRMQYLDVDVDIDIIHLYTDDARRLLELTLADRE
ncbi:MAG: hypothetical protein U5R31_04140 [Acidimicrobiia bacterium]|nr:hypothetical protein [Acidimicrobiia bacterium]